jgi:hypothetical protein
MATRTDNDDQNRAHPSPPSPVHDIVTGGIEGGVGVLGLEPALKKIAGETVENPLRKGVLKRVAGAGLIGAASTGLIGALVSATSKKAKQRKERNLDQFETLFPGITELGFFANRRKRKEQVKKMNAEADFANEHVDEINDHMEANARKKHGAKGPHPLTEVSNDQWWDLNQAATDHLKKKYNVDFENLKPDMIEFDAYDPMSDRSLKSGVRLDKYRKGIRAHEIDRHIHDYLRSAAIGAAAGAVIPGGKLKTRAAIGAGGGTLVAGVLHGIGHEDPYGEQSEDAKLTQRNVPKVAGAAAIVGGLVARYRKKKAVTDAVAGGLRPSFWTGVNRIRKAVSILGSKPSV